MAIVLLTRIDGAEIGIDPSEVFSLSPVPSALLRPAVPFGTYINDGQRLGVVGTVAQVAAALQPPAPVGPQDVFGSTIIVGNVPAGDPDTATSAPFEYVPDIGDGAGVAAAFATVAAAGQGGSVHVRRGIYDLGLPTAPPLPLAIDGFRVTGDGDSTIFRLSTLDRRLFVLTDGGPASVNGPAPELAHIGVDWTVAAPGAVGTEMIDTFGGPVQSRRATLENIEVIKNLGGAGVPASLNPDESLTSIFRTGIAGRIFDCKCINVDGTAARTVVAYRLVGGSSRVDQSAVNGANVGYRTEGPRALVQGCSSGGGLISADHNAIELAGADARVIGNDVIGDNGIVASGSGSIITANNVAFVFADGIRVDAGAVNTIVSLNRMGGAPLTIAEPSALVFGNVL